ncbi:MAG TPA: ATPase, T2SS/T4P/T4SS family [Burkholderiaceae bacterium]|nr:ATPase, T2SS/T4P/T4SS family [Burkholderiaceae bacterium]
MSDLSVPPRRASASTDVPASPWRWPAPPYAGFGLVPPWQDVACDIEGLTSAAIRATLLGFDPASGCLRVRVLPRGMEMDLRFSQFRRLTLCTTWLPASPAEDDPHAALLGPAPALDYTIRLAGGGTLNGRTVGYVESAEGLYLFPPSEEAGGVLRSFVPRAALEHYDIGQRIGELLVQQHALTTEEVDAVAAEQQRLRHRKLGELLLAKSVVSAEQLLAAIDQQARMPVVRIGEALIALNMVTQDQLDQALEQQQADRSVPLGELLVRNGLVSREDLQLALARKMGYPVVDIREFPIEADAVRALPFALARRVQVLPLLLRNGQLLVAMADPSRRAVLDELEFVTQLRVVPSLAHGEALEMAIATAYARARNDPWTAQPSQRDELLPFEAVDAGKLVETLEIQQQQQGSDDEPTIEQSDNSLVRLVNTAIVDAAAQGVSDIHVETHPGREKVRIRFRKDGVLRPYLELPHTYRSAIVARIKIMCDLDISERRKPQDGKINFARFSPQHRLELRVATVPTSNGLEDVVMRLLSSAVALSMDQLGLSPDNHERLRAAIERPYGMVLCVGPTGSGKTTTLHSALAHINTPERKIWTAEDPVEITQAGLRQVQVNPKIDWTFAKALRAFVRADPDVIMVGEIRDTETAQTAIEASLTGHLVLSTLHTNSAPDTVTRLLDMGMDPFNFGDSLLAVLAQRLVRRLCPHCVQAHDARPEEVDELLQDWLHAFPDGLAPPPQTVREGWLQRFGHEGRLRLQQSAGCAHCEGTGFRGRVGLHELMSVSRSLRRMIQMGAKSEELQRQAMAEGMRTLRQDGIEKVLAGLTTVAEVRASANA